MISLLRRALGRAQPVSLWDDEDPIRSELFSIERLEQHAESLAANQPISTTPASGRSLVDRLAQNERVLLEAYRSLAKAADAGRPIPSVVGLLHSYYIRREVHNFSAVATITFQFRFGRGRGI